MYFHFGTLRHLDWRLRLAAALWLVALTALVAPINSAQAATALPANPGTITNAPQFPDCPQASVAPGTATFLYCTTPSASDPTQFNITMIVSNLTTYDLDFSHTVVCNLQNGTRVSKVVTPANNITVSTANNTLIWVPAVIPAGQTRTVSFLITKAVDSAVLVQNVKITGINQLLKSPFAAALTKLQAETETRVTNLDVGGGTPNTPATGFGPAIQTQPDLTLPILLLLGGVFVLSSFWLRRRQAR